MTPCHSALDASTSVSNLLGCISNPLKCRVRYDLENINVGASPRMSPMSMHRARFRALRPFSSLISSVFYRCCVMHLLYHRYRRSIIVILFRSPKIVAPFRLLDFLALPSASTWCVLTLAYRMLSYTVDEKEISYCPMIYPTRSSWLLLSLTGAFPPGMILLLLAMA